MLFRSRDWIASELAAMAPLAAELDLERWLAPLQPVLEQGNQAQRWLAAYGQGTSVAELIAAGAAAMEQDERDGDGALDRGLDVLPLTGPAGVLG